MIPAKGQAVKDHASLDGLGGILTGRLKLGPRPEVEVDFNTQPVWVMLNQVQLLDAAYRLPRFDSKPPYNIVGGFGDPRHLLEFEVVTTCE